MTTKPSKLLAETQAETSRLLNNLKPRIGSLGGCYYQEPLTLVDYRLNDLVKRLMNLSKDNPDHTWVRHSVQKIQSLGEKGEALFKQKTCSYFSLDAWVKWIGTHVRRFLGNLFFDRKQALNAIIQSHPAPALNQAQNNTKVSVQPQVNVPSPLPVQQPSQSSSVIPSELQLLLDTGIFNESTPLPEVNWAIDWSQHDPQRALDLLQGDMIQQTRTFLQKTGFSLNKHDIPIGIQFKTTSPANSKKEIQARKKQIQEDLRTNQHWLAERFFLLSSFGMGGYADAIRTAWAFHVSARANLVANSIPFDRYPSAPKPHEDLWTEAIRNGHEHYNKTWGNLESIHSLQSLFPIAQPDQWDLKNLYQLSANGKNKTPNLASPALRDAILQRKGELQQTQSLTVDACTTILKGLLYVGASRQAAACKAEFIALYPDEQQNFETCWQQVIQHRLDKLEIKEAYLKERQEAQRLTDELMLLYQSFGQGKISKRFVDKLIDQFPYTKNTAFANSVTQSLGSLNNDGFYSVPKDAALNFQGSVYGTDEVQLKARLSHLLSVADGAIRNRYVARRLAPTFYQSTTKNENFEIPTHRLSIVLQYEDLREMILKEVQKQLLRFLGIEWIGRIFQGTPRLPAVEEPEFIVSAFIDSIVSLGGTAWRDKLLDYLRSQRITINSFWENRQELHKHFEAVELNIGHVNLEYTPPRVTKAQELEYQHRRDHILSLFQDGKALVRVIKLAELNDPETGIYNGKWQLNHGPNLSTTLIPRLGSPVNMDLFDKGVRGIMLSPETVVTEDYFGKGFTTNAGTQSNNFKTELQKRKDGMSLKKVRRVLDKEGRQVEVGGKDAKRSHTEIAYFRPAERNLVQGLFFKVNDDQYTKSLKELIQLQKEILDKYGFFLPIFAYKDRRLQEVIVDRQLIQALGVAAHHSALRELPVAETSYKQNHPHLYFNLYGSLDTQTVVKAKQSLSLLPPVQAGEKEEHWSNFKALFDLQLMILQLKGPGEKISFMIYPPFEPHTFITNHFNDLDPAIHGQLIGAAYVQSFKDTDAVIQFIHEKTGLKRQDIETRMALYASSETKRPVDLSIIDNLHLVFPTIVPTSNSAAKAQNLFFSHSQLVRFLRDTEAYRECWLKMAFRNMKVFLGLDWDPSSNTLKFDRQIVNFFSDSIDPTGRQPFAKCIARLIQFLILLGEERVAQAICVECRKELGHNFGIADQTDFFTNSPEIQKLRIYCNQLANPNFSQTDPIPASEMHSFSFSAALFPSRFANITNVVLPSNLDKPAGKLQGSQTNFLTPAIIQQRDLVLNFLNTYQPAWSSAHTASHSHRNQEGQRRKLLLSDNSYNPQSACFLMGAHASSLMQEKAFEQTYQNMRSVRVYYRKNFISQAKVVSFIVNTAMITTDGDTNMVLPDGTTRNIDPSEKSLYLSDEERVLKRAGMVKTGTITLTAQGGYNSPRKPLDKPISVFVITTTAPQFEKYGFEARDFLVTKNGPIGMTAASEEYHGSKTRPTFDVLSKEWQQIREKSLPLKAEGNPFPPARILKETHPASVNADVVRLINGDFFLRNVLQNALKIYLKKLVIPAMRKTVLSSGPSPYIKATSFGTGFFASLGIGSTFQTSLKPYALDALIKTYVELLSEEEFYPQETLEFAFYGEKAPDALLKAAKKAKVHIVWHPSRDLCDFSPVLTTNNVLIDPMQCQPVLFDAGDVFSFNGNEPESNSLESMLGNNSDLRLVFNWHFNHLLLDSQNHIALN